MTSASRAVKSITASVPRPSASVLIVNARNEVLLVQRNPKSQSFAGAYVFPGGNFDKVQDDALETTAVREVFEETGLLLATPSSVDYPTDNQLDEAREAIHTHKKLFRDFLSGFRLTADTASLLPFTQWITPPTVPRRFHTHFYVIFLEDARTKGFTAGNKQERLPTPDGGQEVIAARFVHPKTALEECNARKIRMLPPQFYLLTTLADILHDDTNTKAQRDRVRLLSTGAFGRYIFAPRPLPERDAEGRSILTYEGDETYGGPSGRLHRSLVKFGKADVTTDITIQRNFDIFTEMDAQVPTKL